MVTQRIVNTERQLRCEAELAEAAKAEEVERLKGELTVLQVRASTTYHTISHVHHPADPISVPNSE